jgi:hypothetical protein
MGVAGVARWCSASLGPAQPSASLVTGAVQLFPPRRRCAQQLEIGNPSTPQLMSMDLLSSQNDSLQRDQLCTLASPVTSCQPAALTTTRIGTHRLNPSWYAIPVLVLGHTHVSRQPEGPAN